MPPDPFSDAVLRTGRHVDSLSFIVYRRYTMKLNRSKIELLAEETGADDLARKLAALGHPVRIAILRQLADRDACCVKDVVGRVGLAQSTVSQHIRVLVDAGFVSYRPQRQASCYSIDREALAALSDDVNALLGNCCGHCTKKV